MALTANAYLEVRSIYSECPQGRLCLFVYLIFYGSVRDGISTSDYIASNGRILNE
jgi:hypothetical protein